MSTAPSAHLQLLRRSINCSQELLAERSGVSLRAIRNLESGSVAAPRRSTLRCLAQGLGLSDGETSAFLEMWYPLRAGERSDSDLMRHAGEMDKYLSDAQRAAMAHRHTVDWHGHVFVDAQRWPYRSVTHFVIQAEESGVDSALFRYHHSDDEIDWDSITVPTTTNCEVRKVVTIPQLSVRVYELQLGTTLEKGETYSYTITMDVNHYDGATKVMPHFGTGVLVAGTSVTAEATFDRQAMPTRVRYVWSDHALGHERTVENLRVSRFGAASVKVPNAPTGIHELVWDWPT